MLGSGQHFQCVRDNRVIGSEPFLPDRERLGERFFGFGEFLLLEIRVPKIAKAQGDTRTFLAISGLKGALSPLERVLRFGPSVLGGQEQPQIVMQPPNQLVRRREATLLNGTV